MTSEKKPIRLIVFAVFSALVAIGAIIGCIILGTQSHPCPAAASVDPYNDKLLSQNVDQLNDITKFVADNVNPQNIKQHLQTLTKLYHPAGTDNNMAALDYVFNTWKSYGLDVVTDEYEVLLSYPDYENPNTINLLDGDKVIRISNGTAERLGPPEDQAEQNDDRALLWWNAYANSGNVTGRLVYVNYCGEKDFEIVENANVNVSGSIVLCRFGFGWRGAKVIQAQIRGAVGVILYTDPQTYGPPKTYTFKNETIQGYPPDFVYPNSVYMPPTEAQRGSLLMVNEDPETPIYPAKPYTYRWFNEAELRENLHMPNIPVMPIGYGDAQSIFEAMFENKGQALKNPKHYLRFKGALNVTYDVTSDCTFNLVVSANVTRRPIKNVIAYLRGKDEPDRYVILGNHVDAWTYGAQDPNSGTAVNLEVARVLMAAVNVTGWRPKRTLVFCGWDAEEFSVMGSSEWAEEKMKILESRAVVYLNVDVAVMGNQTLWVQSVPSAYRSVVAAAKRVANPNPDELSKNRTTVYDSWAHYSNSSYLNYQRKTGQFNPNMGQFDPNTGQFEPNMGQFEPNMGQFEPNMGQFEPNMGQFEPNMGQFEPNMGQFEPNMGQFEPNMGQLDPNIGQLDPNMGQLDPNTGHLDPNMGHTSSNIVHLWDTTVPYMPVPAADSDQFAFLDFIGIPVVNFGYHTAYYTGPYPLYHTSYEVQYTFEHFVDANYTTAAAMVKLWAELAKNYADSLAIPFNVRDYGYMMTQYVASLNKTLSEEADIDKIVDNFDLVMQNLTEAAVKFEDIADEIQVYVDMANSGTSHFSVSQMEIINGRIGRLENAFIDPRGLPERPVVRHVVFAPSISNEYSGVVFSGVTDSLAKYKSSRDAKEKENWRKITNLQLTVAQYCIESATQLLTLPPGFSSPPKSRANNK